MRERERERGGGGRIHTLLIHSIFVVAFILFSFSSLYVQYTYSAFVTKLTSSAVTRIEVSSGRRKSLIWKKMFYFENVFASFQARK